MRGGPKEARGQRELAGVASHPVPKGSRGQALAAAPRLKNETLGGRVLPSSLGTLEHLPPQGNPGHSLPTLCRSLGTR